MISHRHRCLYLTVPKCASTSILQWFLAHGAGRHTYPPSWYPGPLERRIVPAARALALYPDYVLFTFLRDPCARFLSNWRDANRRIAAGYPRQPRGYGSLHDFALLCAELLAETRGLWGAGALAFRAEHADRRYGPHGIALRDLYYLPCHARPQVDFLPGGDPPSLFGVRLARPAAPAFTGRVETLAADFARLRARLGLAGPALPRENATQQDTAPAMDAATRRLVEELYAEDYALLAAPPPAPGDAAAPRPTGVRARLGRARLGLGAAEIALEARIARCAPLRRALAPLSHWRRGGA